jgi:hypothetical protein
MDDLYLDGALGWSPVLYRLLIGAPHSTWDLGRGRQTGAQGEQEEEEQEAG